jgi:hypothetical protein
VLRAHQQQRIEAAPRRLPPPACPPRTWRRHRVRSGAGT